MASRLAALMAGVALIAAPLTPVHANPTTAAKSLPAAKAKKKPQVVTEAGVAEKLRPGSLGSFTPSLVDPTRSAAVRVQSTERSFRFTPSGKGDRKALTLGLTSRVLAPAPAGRNATVAALSPTIDGLTPSGYNLGVAVGYKGFSLSGGYTRIDSEFGPHREGVDLGLSYRGNRWKASLQASGEQPSHAALDPLALDKRYAVELGGAYALTPRLSLQGGMRYQLITPLDPRLTDEREDPSVYLGTSFRF